MADIYLKQIRKVYPNGVEAVKDFDLQINDKEFIIFVGPSGCGKTTMLRMIAGLEDLTSGEIMIGGTKVDGLAPKDRDIAMVFQNYALYPHMTVFDNMAFSLKMRKIPKFEIRRKVEEAAEILEITDLLKRKPKALSGGQRQRVAMGRALVRRPKAFLMDEPLSNLDAKLRSQMRIELTRLHERMQTTVVYVTHDQTEAMTLGTRIVVMKDGTAQQIDTPRQVYAHPANIFVAGFMGSPQMNFFEADFDVEDGKPLLKTKGLDIQLSAKQAESLMRHNYNGRNVIAGLRPEDITLATGQNQPLKENGLSGVVRVLEMLGSEAYLHIKTEASNLTLKCNPDTDLRAGDGVLCEVNTDKLHIFDKETGFAIGQEQPL